LARLPDLSGKELIKALVKTGFTVMRQKGSHVILEKNTPAKKFITVVPLHSSLKKGTLSDIIKQAGLTREKLLSLLD